MAQNDILLAYWNELRGSRTMPRRFEIDPGRLTPLLPNMFIAEMDGTFRTRGRNLAEAAHLSEWFAPGSWPAVATVLETMADHPRPARIGLGAVGDMILLPLSLVHDDSRAARMIGAVAHPIPTSPYLATAVWVRCGVPDRQGRGFAYRVINGGLAP